MFKYIFVVLVSAMAVSGCSQCSQQNAEPPAAVETAPPAATEQAPADAAAPTEAPAAPAEQPAGGQ